MTPNTFGVARRSRDARGRKQFWKFMGNAVIVELTMAAIVFAGRHL